MAHRTFGRPILVVAFAALASSVVLPAEAAGPRGPAAFQVERAVANYATQVEAAYAAAAGTPRATSSVSPVAAAAVAPVADALASSGARVGATKVTIRDVTKPWLVDGSWYVDAMVVTTIDEGVDGEGQHEPSSWSDTHRLRLSTKSGTTTVTADAILSAPLTRPYPSEQGGSAAQLGLRPAQKFEGAATAPAASTRELGLPTENKINADAFRTCAFKWTAAPYDGDAAADFNPTNPRAGNNCSNFASQTLDQSGWYFTGRDSTHNEPPISLNTNNRHHIRISTSVTIAKQQGRYPIALSMLKHK